MTFYRPPSSELKLLITDPYTIGTGHSTIRLTYGGADFLDLTLQRKFRVPEDGRAYQNTARNGSLPIYSVEQFAAELISGEGAGHKGEKRGVVVPLFNREAASLHFRSSRPYAVKIFIGSNNAISGEPLLESTTTVIRRKHRVNTQQKIADYFIAGEPKVDFYRTLTANQRQFVNGTEMLTVQVMPVRRVGVTIVIKKIDGVDSTFSIEGLEGGTKIGDVKRRVWEMRSLKVAEQMLILSGKVLEDEKSLAEYDIRDGATIYLLHHTRRRASNGKDYDSDCSSQSDNPSNASSIDRESVFSSKLRKVHTQDWDKENTLTFNIHFVNATAFEAILGIRCKTPLVMSMFKDAKIPVDKEWYNEPVKNSLGWGKENGKDEKMVKLAKENKKVQEIEIARLNGGGKMPEFLLEEEMIARLRDVVVDEPSTASLRGRSGSLSTWPKKLIHPKEESPERNGGEEDEEQFEIEI